MKTEILGHVFRDSQKIGWPLLGPFPITDKASNSAPKDGTASLILLQRI
ncbi:MAG: hypothetical protein ACXAAP_06085 [Candidatus Thorarchaeota archaeon]